MAADTKIEWAHHTFSPWFGCTPVSLACDNCYAEDWATRYGVVGWGPHADRRQAADAYYRNPAKWNRKAERLGTRYRVFPSLCDPFDNHSSIKAEWRRRFYDEIAATPSLDWLLLTKRPENVRKFVPADWLNSWPKNVWIGTTAENQATFDHRREAIRHIPAPVRFLSYEPAVGPIDFGDALECETDNNGPIIRDFHWVIAGGESGPRARPASIQWFREVRDQCQAAGIPFLFKQWGEWKPAGLFPAETPGRFAFGDYEYDRSAMQLINNYPRQFTKFGARSVMHRVGKKAASRLLDGRTWDEFPAP